MSDCLDVPQDFVTLFRIFYLKYPGQKIIKIVKVKKRKWSSDILGVAGGNYSQEKKAALIKIYVIFPTKQQKNKARETERARKGEPEERVKSHIFNGKV